MSDNFSSIEDLIAGDQEKDDESKQAQFAKKSQEIKLKELERSTKKKASSARLPYFNLFAFPISPEALSVLEEKQAIENNVVCFYYDGKNIRLGTTDYKNEKLKEILSDLEQRYYCDVRLYIISKHSLSYALSLYKNLPKIRKNLKGIEISTDDLEKFSNDIKDYRSLNEKLNHVNTTDVVTLVLATAIKTKSSDVHIEAEEKGIVVRFRIDGVLQEAATIEKEKWQKIISRIKLLAKVKINVSTKPQDGRFSIYLKKEKIEIRISFLPTAFGESVVMRLLRPSSIGVPFEDLGIFPQAFEILKKEIKKPNGLILTTGPTGSGKTTTLYAILKKLNTPETKIVTLEDPIEYQLEGINQSQVGDKYGFAQGLRSILRKDPDIVMVGEIRDLETAEIAIQASLTGHLVLSTLHTNDASGVIPRLVDMGVKPYFITPSINGVIGQRLIRKLCMKCRVEHKIEGEEREQVEKILAVISPKSGIDIPTELPKIYKVGSGCEDCNGIGYKGRIGIYEIFTMKDNIKQLSSEGAPAFKILQQAIENGMITMLQDGILKCLQGITSLEEVYRVIGKFDYIDTLYDIVVSQTIGRGIKITSDDIKKVKDISNDLNNIGINILNTPIKSVINIIIASAIENDVGDIHIEPIEKGVKIRFRIDGILHDIVELPKEYYLQILARIKNLSGFPTNVKKSSWDGRFTIFLENNKMDCRISIISGGYGETVVIRLLSLRAKALDMKELGLKPYILKPIENSMQKTKGIIITTGPTGSGKTTTLYSILNELNDPDTKIITIEDPIEYQLEGIMQTQIDVEGGYTFAAAMKSLLRQNPNIMMIGEIRDKETAKVSIEASLTGHLVLSTIHANSAAGAISRFVSLGIERQVLANSIECSIGQRLVRKICPYCKEKINLDPSILEEVKVLISEIENNHEDLGPEIFNLVSKDLIFYKGKGCEKCGGIGYKGRVGIYEAIKMNSDIRKIIQADDSTDYDIEQIAKKSGFISMLQDGILKALQGETTIEEVFRVGR